MARVKPDGSWDSEGGRVEIRYKPTDGRAYRAAAANLERLAGEELLPDDACVAGEAVASAAPAKAPAKQTKAAASAARKADAASKALAPGAVPADAWTIYA